MNDHNPVIDSQPSELPEPSEDTMASEHVDPSRTLTSTPRSIAWLRLRATARMLGSLLLGWVAVWGSVLFALGAYEMVLFRGGSRALSGVAVIIVIAATLEELVFRCVLFRVLERYWGTGAALAVQAVLFALQHLENIGNGGTSDVVVML